MVAVLSKIESRPVTETDYGSKMSSFLSQMSPYTQQQAFSPQRLRDCLHVAAEARSRQFIKFLSKTCLCINRSLQMCATKPAVSNDEILYIDCQHSSKRSQNLFLPTFKALPSTNSNYSSNIDIYTLSIFMSMCRH